MLNSMFLLFQPLAEEYMSAFEGTLLQCIHGVCRLVPFRYIAILADSYVRGASLIYRYTSLYLTSTSGLLWGMLSRGKNRQVLGDDGAPQRTKCCAHSR